MDFGFDRDDANRSHLALHDITPDETEQVRTSYGFAISARRDQGAF